MKNFNINLVNVNGSQDALDVLGINLTRNLVSHIINLKKYKIGII